MSGRLNHREFGWKCGYGDSRHCYKYFIRGGFFGRGGSLCFSLHYSRQAGAQMLREGLLGVQKTSQVQ